MIWERRLIKLPAFIKKISVVVIVVVFLVVLSSCDFMQDDVNIEQSYLNISADNEYGVETLEPDLGRYRYEDGAIVDIDFAEAEGYEFLGWQGSDGDDVVKTDSGQYQIEIDGDMSINADLELTDFMILVVDFSGLEAIDYNEISDIDGVPHDLDSVELKFNNELHPDNELIARIKDSKADSDGDNLEDIEIDDDKIIINLVDWRDRFYLDEDDENYLEFGEEYELTVGTNYSDNIIDSNNKEIDEEEIVLNFIVEEPYPEIPDSVRLDNENGSYELSWHRSKENASIDVNEFVKEYIVYKFVGDSDFKEEDADKEIIVDVTNPDDKKVIREGDLEAAENIYYRVKAINSYGNESGLSETVGLD